MKIISDTDSLDAFRRTFPNPTIDLYSEPFYLHKGERVSPTNVYPYKCLGFLWDAGMVIAPTRNLGYKENQTIDLNYDGVFFELGLHVEYKGVVLDLSSWETATYWIR